MKPTKKTKPAIWHTAFPEQAAKLRPENTERGGVKARSGGAARRMEVYHAIRDLYLKPNGAVRVCSRCGRAASDVHHKAGREGLLLFDVRHWMAVCRPCHTWIHAHPKEAAQRGWLAWKGQWNKQENNPCASAGAC